MPEKPKLSFREKITRRFTKEGKIEIARERRAKIKSQLGTLKLWLDGRGAFEKDPLAQRDKLYYWVGGTRQAYLEASKKLTPKELEKWKRDAEARYNALKRATEKGKQQYNRLLSELIEIETRFDI